MIEYECSAPNNQSATHITMGLTSMDKNQPFIKPTMVKTTINKTSKEVDEIVFSSISKQYLDTCVGFGHFKYPYDIEKDQCTFAQSTLSSEGVPIGESVHVSVSYATRGT